MSEQDEDLDQLVATSYLVRSGRFVATLIRVAADPGGWDVSINAERSASESEGRMFQLPVRGGGDMHAILSWGEAPSPVLPVRPPVVWQDAPPVAEARQAMARLEALAERWADVMRDFEAIERGVAVSE